MQNQTVEMDGETLKPFVSYYIQSNNPALSLYTLDNLPYATASVNPDETLPDGYIAIKDWSENTGILDVLQKHGIVGEVEWEIPMGWVNAKVCKLLIPVE